MPVSLPRWGSSSVTASASGAPEGDAALHGQRGHPGGPGQDTAVGHEGAQSKPGQLLADILLILRQLGHGLQFLAGPDSGRTGPPPRTWAAARTRSCSSSRALMVRPLAGKPISSRSKMSPDLGSSWQAVRSRTSWPQRLTETSPLWPEPLAWWETCRRQAAEPAQSVGPAGRCAAGSVP